MSELCVLPQWPCDPIIYESDEAWERARADAALARLKAIRLLLIGAQFSSQHDEYMRLVNEAAEIADDLPEPTP